MTAYAPSEKMITYREEFLQFLKEQKINPKAERACWKIWLQALETRERAMTIPVMGILVDGKISSIKQTVTDEVIG
jgi:hypothetical protein